MENRIIKKHSINNILLRIRYIMLVGINKNRENSFDTLLVDYNVNTFGYISD